MTWLRDPTSPIERWTAQPYRKPHVELEVIATADGRWKRTVRVWRAQQWIAVAPATYEPEAIEDELGPARAACEHAYEMVGGL